MFTSQGDELALEAAVEQHRVTHLLAAPHGLENGKLLEEHELCERGRLPKAHKIST